MFHLFTEEQTIAYGVALQPETEYIKRSYLRELLHIEDYYHNRSYAVKSNHLLNQLLIHTTAPYEYTLDRFVEVVRTRAPYVAKAFKLTSELDSGMMHDGVFYGPGSPEFIFYEDTYFDPYLVAKHWKNAVAVRPLWHQRSDMKLLFPNGREVTDEKGLSAVSINLPMLVLQHRCFVMEQMLKPDDGARLTTAHFVHKYVLPNLLYQSTDLSVLNRCMRLYYNRPTGHPTFKHAFRIADLTDKLDRVLLKLMNGLSNTSTPYAAVIETIPAVSQPNALTALRLPDFAPTRHIRWSTLVARLQVMKFIIDLGGSKGIARNRGEINALQRVVRRVQGENDAMALLPPALFGEMKEIMDFVMAL